MRTDDQSLLDYARIWVPYGGPRRGDLLVEFGLTPVRFYARLRRILTGTGSHTLGLPSDELRRLRALVDAHPVSLSL